MKKIDELSLDSTGGSPIKMTRFIVQELVHYIVQELLHYRFIVHELLHYEVGAL